MQNHIKMMRSLLLPSALFSCFYNPPDPAADECRGEEKKRLFESAQKVLCMNLIL